MKPKLLARLVLAVILLAGCADHLDTIIPADISKLETIKPAVDKLSDEERTLLTGYIARHTIGSAMASAFGGKADPIPEGMTIGKAIAEQRKLMAEKQAQEQAESALKAKLVAEQAAAVEAMRKAASVTIVSKKLENEYGYSGIVMDEMLNISVGYQNHTDKEIAGIKGMLIIQDLFGDEVTSFQISNDESIPPKGTTTWRGSRSVKYSLGTKDDRKFAELPADKYKQVWEPQIIVFKDGSKLTLPE